MKWTLKLSAIILIAFGSCLSQKRQKFKKKYYPSGNLMSYGNYIHDTIPVDTLITFSEDGKLFSREVFDSKGKSIIAIQYYKNASLKKIINYEHGKANNFSYEFTETGKVSYKYFYYNDQQVGDIYGFDQNGNIDYYGFLDFEGHNMNLVTYDKGNKILKDIRHAIFIDSLEIYTDSADHNRTTSLLLIISNPPQCKSKLKIDYLSKNEYLIHSDSISTKNYCLAIETFPDTIGLVRITGSQYDSIKMKTIFQESTIQLQN